MKMNYIFGLGALGIIALLILLALGQRKRVGELMNKWEKEMNRLKQSESDASATAKVERERIRKELKDESKKNIVNLFFDAFKRNPMGGDRS